MVILGSSNGFHNPTICYLGCKNRTSVKLEVKHNAFHKEMYWIYLEMSSVKCRPFYPCLNILKRIVFTITAGSQQTCTRGKVEIGGAPPDTSVTNNWPFFPILSFNIGDTKNRNEFVEYFLGPLNCEQGTVQFS